MKVLAMATSLVEAPRTATVSGANSGRKVSSGSAARLGGGTAPADTAGSSMTRASAATAPEADTINGLRSSSATVLACRIRSPSAPPIRSITSTSASVSTAASPRKPVSSAWPLSSPSIARASAASIGQMRKATSFNTSTKTPPRPTMIIGPNCGSRRPPTTTSRPGGIISSTSHPSTRALAIAGFIAIASTAARTAPASRSPSATPPASDLCRMSGETTLTANGGVRAAARLSASAAVVASAERGVRMP